MAKPRLNMKRIAKEAKAARSLGLTKMDLSLAKSLVPDASKLVTHVIAQAFRDERMVERERCTRIVDAALDVCSDPASRAALQFASSQINAKTSARSDIWVVLSAAKQSESK